MKEITRDQAISSGLKLYFTGKPCKRNHICYRNVVGRTCVECKKLSDKESVERRRRQKGKIEPPFDGKIISRKDAINLGYRYYFTGKECKNGHTAFRDVVNAACAHCSKEFKPTDEAKNARKVKQKEWAERNAIRVAEIKRNWIENNPEKIRASRDKFNEKRNEKRRELLRIKDPDYIAEVTFRGMVKRILKYSGKKKRLKTQEILGYNIMQLKSRLEFQFKDGMSWSNYGEWEVDHRKPVARFFRQGIDNPAIINALSNLQPLWKDENRAKSDKWIY